MAACLKFHLVQSFSAQLVAWPLKLAWGRIYASPLAFRSSTEGTVR